MNKKKNPRRVDGYNGAPTAPPGADRGRHDRGEGPESEWRVRPDSNDESTTQIRWRAQAAALRHHLAMPAHCWPATACLTTCQSSGSGTRSECSNPSSGVAARCTAEEEEDSNYG
eukprot:scaffold1316_cov130-Isochrysis_galbana.AAC.11